MITLGADVEVDELKGAVAVFEEAVLEVAEVDIVVVGLSCRWSSRRTSGAMGMTEMRRGCRHGRGRCCGQRSQGHRGRRRKAGYELEGRCRSRCSQAACAPRRWLDLPDLAARRGRKHASVLPILGVQGRGPQPRGCDVVVLDEEEAVRERTHRRAWLSDDARERLASMAQRWRG